MRIFLSMVVIAIFCNSIVVNVYAEDASVGEVSEKVLRKNIKKDYIEKINKASLMQRKVLGYRESEFGINSIETLGILEALAWMSMEQQDFKEAGMFYRRVIKIRKEVLPASDDNTSELASAYFMLGDSYLNRSQFGKAVTSYDESLSIDVDHGRRGDTLNRKGMAYEGLNDHENAIEIFLEALKEYDVAKTIDPENSISINKQVRIINKRLPKLKLKLKQEKRRVEEDEI